MKFELNDTGLYCYSSEQWHRIGGRIEVVARTRLSDRRHGHGVLLQWCNLDDVMLREVVYARHLNGDNAKQIRELLVDTGYPLEPGNISWTRLQHYLLEEMAKAPPATVVDRTGWHGSVFATSSWTIGQAEEQHHFVGQLSRTPILQESGTLEEWQAHVGRFCQGNPLAIFSIGVALAAPLLKPAGLENGAFHLVGLSSTGKTTLLQIATSVYGPPGFMRSWVSTTNGLPAVSAEHSDMLLPLDEIGLARPEDVDTAIYHIMNGSSKLRATISGDLATQTYWRALVLSSGEIWVSELLQQIGKSLKAGQQTRLVEIPVFGAYGVFDNIHGSKTSQEFADSLKDASRNHYGTLFREWISYLSNSSEVLATYLQGEINRLTDCWTAPHMASQVVRVIRRFALVATALCLACRNYLLPWSEEESIQSVKEVIAAWLVSRGHIFNFEEYRLITELARAIATYQGRLTEIESGAIEAEHFGFKRVVNSQEQWLIPKERFLKHFGLPTRYMREVEPLIQKGFLETNERSRGTLRITVEGSYQRFFALWPERVNRHLASLPELDGLSQFPSIPSHDPEVAEHE